MPDAAFACPDLTTFTGLDGLGLEVTGQLVEPDRAVLACRVAEGLGVSWATASNAVLAEGLAAPGRRLGSPERGWRWSPVGEHVWRHTRRGDEDVTVVIDLTPVRDRTGPSRLSDVVEGRSKRALKGWLAQRDQT